MERGLIPPATQVELDPPPVVNKTVAMHSFHERTSKVPADQTGLIYNIGIVIFVWIRKYLFNCDNPDYNPRYNPTYNPRYNPSYNPQLQP